MEDLWDETVFGESSPAQSTSANFLQPGNGTIKTFPAGLDILGTCSQHFMASE
jgi:hypothetical protein